MNNIKVYSTSMADVIMKKFSVCQMKRTIYFNKMPRLIFFLKQSTDELSDYEIINTCVTKFKGNLKWGLFKCVGSKRNYMISPKKWYEIERSADFNGEDELLSDQDYLKLRELAVIDYELLVNFMEINL